MNNKILAEIVAFYLSKYVSKDDQERLNNLRFDTISNAFEKTAELLGVEKKLRQIDT